MTTAPISKIGAQENGEKCVARPIPIQSDFPRRYYSCPPNQVWRYINLPKILGSYMKKVMQLSVALLAVSAAAVTSAQQTNEPIKQDEPIKTEPAAQLSEPMARLVENHNYCNHGNLFYSQGSPLKIGDTEYRCSYRKNASVYGDPPGPFWLATQ